MDFRECVILSPPSLGLRYYGLSVIHGEMKPILIILAHSSCVILGKSLLSLSELCFLLTNGLISTPALLGRFIHSPLPVSQQILIEHLLHAVCSEDAAMIKTHTNHCPPGAFVSCLIWKPSAYSKDSLHFARREGCQGACPRPHGKFGTELGLETPDTSFLLPWPLLKALTGPQCSHGALAGMLPFRVPGSSTGADTGQGSEGEA